MRQRSFLPLLLCLTLSVCGGCSNPSPGGPPAGLPQGIGTAGISPSPSSSPVEPSTPEPTVGRPKGIPTAPAVDFCLDRRPLELLRFLKEALKSADGSLFASLVDPVQGMDVQFLRNGTIVNYDREHARHLFETTYSENWGSAAGSGQPVQGSFHELVVPALLDVLSRDYLLACNRLRVGGATYTPVWPFRGIDFYSAHFAGTDPYGGLDWRTWAVGMQYVDGKPFLRALTQFQWEP